MKRGEIKGGPSPRSAAQYEMSDEAGSEIHRPMSTISLLIL